MPPLPEAVRTMSMVRTFGSRLTDYSYRVRPAAYAVIFDDEQRVACVAEESGLFLPGGGLEPGEDALRAVHREVAEECARTVEIIATLDPAIQFLVTIRGEAQELHASFFLASFSDMLERSPQHELTWQSAESRPPFYHECHRWAVEQALLRSQPNKHPHRT